MSLPLSISDDVRSHVTIAPGASWEHDIGDVVS